jgi:VanZ family protein
MAWVRRYGPPLVLMGVIFYFSAQPHADDAGDLGWFWFLARKLAHLTEYGLLWLACLRALDWRSPRAAAAIALAYSISDEFHQSFVPTRDGTPRDVAIDAAGMLIAYLLWRRRRRVVGQAA